MTGRMHIWDQSGGRRVVVAGSTDEGWRVMDGEALLASYPAQETRDAYEALCRWRRELRQNEQGG